MFKSCSFRISQISILFFFKIDTEIRINQIIRSRAQSYLDVIILSTTPTEELVNEQRSMLTPKWRRRGSQPITSRFPRS